MAQRVNALANTYLQTAAYTNARPDLSTSVARWLKDGTRGGTVGWTAKFNALVRNGYAKQIVSEAGLLGYWRLAAASGTSEPDLSGKGATGTYVNAVTLGVGGAQADGATAVTLIASGSGAGDGGSYLTATITAPGAAWTVEAWIKRGTDAALREIVSISPIEVPVGAGATVVQYFDGVATRITGVKTVTDNAWHHVVVTCDGATTTLYVDGAVDGTPFGGAVAVNATAFNVGRFYTGGFTWNGTLDDVAIYNVALSAARVLAHYSLA